VIVHQGHGSHALEDASTALSWVETEHLEAVAAGSSPHALDILRTAAMLSMEARHNNRFTSVHRPTYNREIMSLAAIFSLGRCHYSRALVGNTSLGVPTSAGVANVPSVEAGMYSQTMADDTCC
jgi:hypothetical protein